MQQSKSIVSLYLSLGALLALLLPGAVRAEFQAVGVERSSATELTISWGSDSGNDYEVQTSTGLNGGWSSLAGPLPGSGDVMTLNVEILDAVRFFQVVESNSGVGPDPTRFAWIEPGTFTMGSPITEVDRNSNEGPQTVVTLTQGFWMSRFEVTQQEYLDRVGSNPSRWKGDLKRPVESVSWSNATNYCHLFTEAQRASGALPAGYVYRLPAEAEWEYACRAGSTTRLNYGDDPGYASLTSYAWFMDNSGYTTHPVGELEPNAWGLYDMQGNVYEWCWDRYAGSFPGGEITDPTGPSSGSSRVIRGAGNESVPEAGRSAYRGPSLPFFTSGAGGFRVVLGVPLE